MVLQVDAVIVVCTSYVPTPSVSAAIVNHFKMKSSVLAYSLSGMGCAASIIAIDLAQELLQVHAYTPNRTWSNQCKAWLGAPVTGVLCDSKNHSCLEKGFAG